jgi:hypothetical protein
MDAKKMLCSAVIAAAVIAVPAHAAKPGPGPAPDCLRYDYSFALSADGQSVHVVATITNTCFPRVDMEGDVGLWVGGALVAHAPLGPGDSATLEADIPLDAIRGQEICLEFKGTRAEVIRGKLRVAALEARDCRTAAF